MHISMSVVVIYIVKLLPKSLLLQMFLWLHAAAQALRHIFLLIIFLYVFHCSDLSIYKRISYVLCDILSYQRKCAMRKASWYDWNPLVQQRRNMRKGLVGNNEGMDAAWNSTSHAPPLSPFYQDHKLQANGDENGHSRELTDPSKVEEKVIATLPDELYTDLVALRRNFVFKVVV